MIETYSYNGNHTWPIGWHDISETVLDRDVVRTGH